MKIFGEGAIHFAGRLLVDGRGFSDGGVVASV